MKILTVEWNIFTKTNQGYEISRNGGSVMVSDIAEYIGRKEESYLYQGSICVPDMDYGHIHVIGNEDFVPQQRMPENISQWQEGLVDCFSKVIEKGRFDYVFIHGEGEFCSNCIDVCKKYGQLFALVCHLFDPEEANNRLYLMPGIDIITVGTCLKKEILDNYPTIHDNQISVILNGVPSYYRSNVGKIKRNMVSERVLLCSASLQPRKNQIQLIRAFSLLPEEVRKCIRLVLCGKDSVRFPTYETLNKTIRELHLEKNVDYIGSRPRNEMPGVYGSADGLVLPSLKEGLSLAVLEMIQYGKPVIMFADNETAIDIKDSNVAILVNNHTDEALADAIVKWYGRKWDETYIKKYSEYYRMERVAEDYINYCVQRIREGKGNVE